MTLLAAILVSFTLSFHPADRATSYAIERQAVLDSTVWTATPCGVEPCSMRVYAPAVSIVEQVRVRAINAAGSTLSEHAWTLLALNWSLGRDCPSVYRDNGGMQGTLVKVLLPSPRWTVVCEYKGAIPVRVVATCNFDTNHDGEVNLSDFVSFAEWFIENGKPLNELANFGADYGSRKQEWR